MKISTLNNISTIKKYTKVKSSQQQDKNKTTQQNKDFLAYPKNYQPSFGISEIIWTVLTIGLAGLSIYNAHLMDKKNAEDREKEFKETTAEIKNNINKIANENHLTFEEAKIYHDNYLKIAMIEPKGDGNEVGLNAVMGYAPIKYKLAVDFITPLVANENKYGFKDKSIPNGMLLFGPHGSGKTYMAEKTCEHLKHFGVNVIDLTLDDIDHEKNEELIFEAFEEGKEYYKRTGKYTVINFTQDFDEFFVSRKKNTELIHEVRMFLACADGCRDEGVTWIGTANNPQEIDPAIIRPGRTDIKLPIGNMKNFSAADMLKYTLIKNGENKSAENLNYDEIANIMQEDMLAFTPAEYDDIIKKAIDKKNNSEELIDSNMILEVMYERYRNKEQLLNPVAKAKFSDDKLYIENIDKNTENDVNLLSETTPESVESEVRQKINEKYADDCLCDPHYW